MYKNKYGWFVGVLQHSDSVSHSCLNPFQASHYIYNVHWQARGYSGCEKLKNNFKLWFITKKLFEFYQKLFYRFFYKKSISLHFRHRKLGMTSHKSKMAARFYTFSFFRKTAIWVSYTNIHFRVGWVWSFREKSLESKLSNSSMS